MNTIEELFNQSIYLARNERYQDAINSANKMLKQYPEDSNGYYCLSLIYSTLEDWDNVITVSVKGLDINPKSVGCLNHLGVAFCEKGKLIQGFVFLQRGADLGDENCLRNLRYWRSKLF